MLKFTLLSQFALTKLMVVMTRVFKFLNLFESLFPVLLWANLFFISSTFLCAVPKILLLLRALCEMLVGSLIHPILLIAVLALLTSIIGILLLIIQLITVLHLGNGLSSLGYLNGL